jgi:hypothetical protein
MMPNADPLFHSVPTSARKPGRPIGSKVQVVQDARALGVHHFAFVRSSILGLDLAESFERYMAWAEYSAATNPLEVKV